VSLILEKLAAFLLGPVGRWLVVAALVTAAVFAAGWHERNVGWNERDVQAKQETKDLNQSWVKAEQAAITKAQADARAEEERHRKDLAAIQAQREKDAQDAKVKHDKDVAAARSGALKLRDTAATCSSGPDVSSAAGGGNPATQIATLSDGFTALLIGNADEADALVADDNACWQIVASHQKVFSTTGVKP